MTGKAPSMQEEMAKFSGFTTNNGATVAADDKDTKTSSADVDLSTDERNAGVTIAGGEARQGGKQADSKSAKIELTADEEAAAIEKAGTALGLKDGEDLTVDEKAEALTEALKAKKETSKSGSPESSRVKRAQDGRRRAEARAARAEQKTSDLERRLAALEAGGKALLTGDTKDGKPDTKDKEPDPKDFEFGEVDPKFIRALTRWEVRQEMAETSKTQETKQRGSAQERAAAEFAEKKLAFEDAGLDAFDDFQEVVMDTVGLPKSDPAAWPLSATIGQLLFESEQGAQIAYALASDPKEAKRVDKLTTAQQRLWFARQEAKFSSDEDANKGGKDEQADDTRGTGDRQQQIQTRQVSKAPPPPRRNNGGSGNKQVSAATTDFRAFEAMAIAPDRR